MEFSFTRFARDTMPSNTLASEPGHFGRHARWYRPWLGGAGRSAVSAISAKRSGVPKVPWRSGVTARKDNTSLQGEKINAKNTIKILNSCVERPVFSQRPLHMVKVCVSGLRADELVVLLPEYEPLTGVISL